MTDRRGGGGALPPTGAVLASQAATAPSPAPSPERMTALDATFLFAEKPYAPLHLGAVSIFEGAPFFDERGVFRLDDVRRRVEERLPLIPRFRRRPRFVPFQLARPFWVDDDRFDIANHVKLMVLPSPGTRAELDDLCGQLHMRILDRDHPLWELWFIGGLEDGNVAMVEKVHHAMVDGVSGVEIAAALLDLDPSPEPQALTPWIAAPSPSVARLAAESLREDIAQPLDVLRLLRSQLSSPAELAALATGLPDLARTLLTRSPEPIRMRHVVGATRTLRSVTAPLERLRDVSHRFDATINDIALAAVGGGARALMAHRGDAYEDASLQVLVPVSVRSSAETLALGNRVSTMVTTVPLGDADVTTRLAAVRAAMARIKADRQAAGAEIVVESLELLPSFVLAALSPAVHNQPFVDVVVTNIPGPPCPLFFLGAEMLESTPVVPLGGNLAIGVALLSYNGRLTFGIHADPHACPDITHFVDAVQHDLDALLDAAPGPG